MYSCSITVALVCVTESKEVGFLGSIAECLTTANNAVEDGMEAYPEGGCVGTCGRIPKLDHLICTSSRHLAAGPAVHMRMLTCTQFWSPADRLQLIQHCSE